MNTGQAFCFLFYHLFVIVDIVHPPETKESKNLARWPPQDSGGGQKGTISHSRQEIIVLDIIILNLLCVA